MSEVTIATLLGFKIDWGKMEAGIYLIEASTLGCNKTLWPQELIDFIEAMEKFKEYYGGE